MLKSTITNWLTKCKAKAVRTVEAEMNEKILSFYYINSDIKFDDIYFGNFKRQLEVIKARYGSEFGFCEEPKYYSRTTYCYYYGRIALIMAYLENYKCEKELEEILAISKKKDKVASEYNNLIDKVRQIRKVDKALQYIKDLGFDISTLSEANTVDKKYLFVCGDNKPDITKEQE